MTTPSEPAAEAAASPAGRERRLHPLSWLFVLVQQLKQFAIPLLIVLFGGGADRNELYSLIGVGALALYSIFQYFTYRYRIGPEGLTIRSGVFQKTVRHIPFDRLHNVSLQQALLHRLFKVAEVRLESAGGVRPEASMRVLSLRDAQALEHLVRHHAARAHGESVDAAADTAPPLHTLGAGELLRLGVISNRGMLLVVGAVGVFAQYGDRQFGKIAKAIGAQLMGWSRDLHLEVAGMVVGVLGLLVLAVVLVRALSVAYAFLQFHGFVLRAHGSRLHVQRGLLTRLRGSLPRARIQAFDVHEGVLHRWFGRQSLRVDTMAMETQQEGASMRSLVPLATPQRLDELLGLLLPQASWPPAHWQPLHPRAWLRRFVPGALFWIAVATVATWRFGPPGLLVLAGVPWAALAARRWAQRAGYAVTNDLIAVRTGWLERHWRFAEPGKVQGLRLSRSPLDRRTGMATLLLDTAGASQALPALAIRYLPEAQAAALYAQLADTVARVPPPARTRVIRARTPASAAPAP